MSRKQAPAGWVGVLLTAAALVVAGCSGRQSAIEPAGRGAEEIARLFWWMTGGAAVIWLGVAALTIYAFRARHDASRERRATILIIGGGALVPTVILSALLLYGLSMLPRLLAPA